MSNKSAPPNRYLVAGATLSAAAALIHLACIAIGGPGYRFFGAGERMARMAEAGHWYPAVVATAIAALLTSWSLYALSGAGLIRRLPFLKVALCAITAVYLGRGLAFAPLMPFFPGNSTTFWVVSSAICLAIGLVHFAGVRQTWARL